MRTLAIDLGEKRVGLAMSDEGGQIATPLDVLEVSSPEHAIAQILAIVEREGVKQILLGLPLDMSGAFGPSASRAFAWGVDLHQQSKIPLVFVDERLSSFEVEQRLIERKRSGEKITRRQKKQQLDALVAAQLLREFLTRGLAPIRTLP